MSDWLTSTHLTHLIIYVVSYAIWYGIPTYPLRFYFNMITSFNSIARHHIRSDWPIMKFICNDYSTFYWVNGVLWNNIPVYIGLTRVLPIKKSISTSWNFNIYFIYMYIKCVIAANYFSFLCLLVLYCIY